MVEEFDELLLGQRSNFRKDYNFNRMVIPNISPLKISHLSPLESKLNINVPESATPL